MSRDVNRFAPLISDSYVVGSGGAKAGHAAALSNGLAVLAGANVKPAGVFEHDALAGEVVSVITVGQVPVIVNADSANLVAGDRLTTAAGGLFVKTGSGAGQTSSVTVQNAADADGVMVSAWVNVLEVPFTVPN